MRKIIYILIVSIIAIKALTGCQSVGTYGVIKVAKVPKGFIMLDEALEQTKDVMRSFFHENHVALLDADETCIFSTVTNDRGFIVEYDGKPYVNEKKYFEIAEEANVIHEKKNRQYEIGETVEMRGIKDGGVTIYSVTVVSVIRKDVDSGVKYEIKIAVDPDVPYNDGLRFLDHIMTTGGELVYSLKTVDAYTVCVDLAKDEQIAQIILKGPAFPDYTRTVVIR